MIRSLPFTVLLATAAFALSSVAATAASFDCSKAGSAVEQMICGDPELSRLDEVLADAYRHALSAVAQPDEFRAGPSEWLSVHRDPCDDRLCLKIAYRQRIGELEGPDGFTAANGVSKDTLAEFLRMELTLNEEARFIFAPVRSPTESAARRIAVAASWVEGGPHLGVIDVSGERPRVLSWERYDCVCQSVGSMRSVRLVADEPEFLVTEYVPMSGTCVASVPMEVLRVDEQGSVARAWQGLTYFAGGPPAEANIAEITFTHHGHDANLAILRTARWVRCGDDNCFCQDGTLIREYVELFVWDPAVKRFRMVE